VGVTRHAPGVGSVERRVRHLEHDHGIGVHRLDPPAGGQRRGGRAREIAHTASPLPDDTHNTVPPRACTRAAKSTGTAPANDTMWRPVAAALPVAGAALLTVIAERAGARRATCSEGTRASSRHAAAATSPRTAHRETDVTSGTGRLG